jgi:hypothetical protein
MPEARHPFEYQAPTDEQIMNITNVRTACTIVFKTILDSVPPCAERTLAIRKLEEASMWANKAIVFDGERYI